ncbi:MAG: T9SS C-terminal target domain-containing protein, partial [Flavobacteriales bacterium]|nr:T9SS C-terminal target domain-containing protein [Flavobacteriales bacterium]
MMRTDRLLLAFFLLSVTPVFAGKSPGRTLVNTTTQQKTSSADCDPPTAQTDLDVNNVRTRLMNGGDMWWDLNVERYEIPKNSNKHSMFAGSLWIGGFDSGKQLKVAAQTYRQNGTDFWPGPLSANGSTDQATCKEWDTHFKINRSVVEQFVEDYNNSPGTSIPDVIANWPAHGNTANGEDYYMAPFTDVDGNGSYDPSAGDYPGFDIDGTQGCDAGLFGDQAIWWVFNDRGNIHTETGAEPIGLEIHAQAFGFATNDEINNMTFYRYKIINRSSFRLDSTYFGQWADPDLGNRLDDYVGCDVGRGL